MQRGLALVGERAAPTILPQAQDLPPRAQLPVFGVVKRIALKGPLGHQRESKRLGGCAKSSRIRHGKLQLDLRSLHGVSLRPVG